MIFATPRSWERVSDILKKNSDLTNPVVINKIAGNIGEAEAAQFAAFIGDEASLVTVDDYLAKKVAAPEDADKVAVLTNAMVDRVSYVRNTIDAEKLTPDERREIESVIDGIFRLGVAENVIVGVRDLLELNRKVIQQIFLEMDNPEIEQFLADNTYLLGLDRCVVIK
jgi:hypothetical protein